MHWLTQVLFERHRICQLNYVLNVFMQVLHFVNLHISPIVRLDYRAHQHRPSHLGGLAASRRRHHGQLKPARESNEPQMYLSSSCLTRSHHIYAERTKYCVPAYKP